jgi:RHS repeat-associated protein
MIRRFGFGLFAAILLSGLSASTAIGQSYLQAIGQPPFSTSLPVKDGFINAGNGDLHLEIPLGSFAQRGGHTENISLMYDSDIWSPNGYSKSWTPDNPYTAYAAGYGNPPGQGGWRLSASEGAGVAVPGVVLGCAQEYYSETKYTPWTWYAPDGTAHSFPVATIENTDYPYCPAPDTPNATGVANDGSGYSISITNYTDATIYGPDGTVYSPSNKIVYGGTSTSTTTDSNGNQDAQSVTFDTNGNVTDVKFIDTAGRTVVEVTKSPDGNTLYYAVPKPGGGTNTYTVRLTTVYYSTSFGQPYVSENSGSFQAISEIDLPDGSAYHFTYDSGTGSGHYGLLTSMTLPTGGAISYGYQNFTDAYGNKSRWIQHQWTPDSSVPWSYQPSVITTCPHNYVDCQQQLVVTAPSSDTTYYYFALNGGPYLFEVVRYASPGNGAGTTYACYSFVTADDLGDCTYSVTQAGAAWNVYKTWQRDTIGTASKSAKYVWDPANNGNLNTLSEWDFGSSVANAPDRTTTMTYYKNGYVFDKPATITVTDKNGTQISQTINGYDENNGSPQCACGNLTSVTRWLNTGGSNPKTQYVYNSYGMVTKKADPNDPTIANPTIYTYDATGVYLSSIQYPTPSDGVQQIENFSYDAGTGVINWSKNLNGNQTSYSYDSIGRLTQINYPDGGQTTYTYPSANEVDFSKKITSSISETGSSLVDGLGRPSRTLVSNGESTPYNEVDTCYDVDGRLSYKSYPYQSTGQYLPSCTPPGDTFAYDGLDRTTSVTHVDNSRISVSYANNCSTTTDEAGKTRETCVDGEGHITEVIENPGGLNYTTNYTYDPLGNLTTVVQSGSRNRTFSYDSLSRLINSDNPETNASGPATAYIYDANGNLTSRTDARSITTSYAYDALNRVTQKSYSDSTPGVTYAYDQSACLGESTCSNVGRRTSMTDAAGSEQWAYDSMGRTLVEQRTTNSLTKSATYAYNLLGAPVSVEYPSGRIINYTYNAGNRPFSATDATTGVNYADVVHYTASGAPCWEDYGDTITAAETLNSLLQPSGMQATSGIVTYSGGGCPGLGQTGNLIDLSYNFAAGQDNGDVIGITNNIDNTRSQAFAYDPLNRITSAETTSTYSTSPAHCWGESYQYDNQTSGGAFGNLTTIGVASSAYNGCTQESLNQSVLTNNQISGFCYDAAGNLLGESACPASTYTYNAENELTSTAGVNYTYDGDGDRIEKSNGTIYWYDPNGNVLDETDLSGNVKNEYVYLSSQRIARLDSSANVFYYAVDHLGTSRVIAEVPPGTQTATLCYDADFYPFGGERPYVDTCDSHYKFTGKERDAESNLDNFGARYFGSSLGRFMSPDPLGGHLEDPQTLNRYAYARNNPVSLTDPTGLDSYLTCTPHADQNASTCQQEIVGYDKNGKAQTAWVQGVTNNGQFTATLIGNDANGNLVDKTTGTGTYTASVNGSGVQFSNNGGQTSSTGVFVNGTPQTTFQDAGWANNNALTGFNFTLTNSKLEADQLEAGTFTFNGTPDQAGAALLRAGFIQHNSSWFEPGFNTFRSPGSFLTGANSGHFNIYEINLNPLSSVPQAQGNMHFGEHDPFRGVGALAHCFADGAC